MRRHLELLDQAIKSDQKALQDGNQSPRVPIDLAAVHTIRGEKDKALSWLQQGYDVGWRDHWTLGKDPIFQSLRGEPAFQALLKRMESDVVEMRRRVNIKETLPVPLTALPMWRTSQQAIAR
ncbi:MAG: hypothetical protein LC804_26545 [Acidobacteria bacterium]|nr:hypothetical protein [Acidobacteriota bacterium]